MTSSSLLRLIAAAPLPLLGALTLAACGPRGESYEAARAETDQSAIETRWLDGVSLGPWLDCTRESGATLVQAHRGGPRPGYAENAISTFERSIEDGAVFLEMDVARTQDGVLVLMHDDTVDRTTTGTGRVDEMTLEEFQALRLVDETGQALDEAPPTFAEALAALDGIGIAQVDLKDITLDQAISGLEEGGAIDRAVLITYSLDDAIAAHRRAPGLMVSAGLFSQADFDRLREEGVDLTRIVAWLGLGSGEPEFDAWLAGQGIETSFGDFRAEAAGTADYLEMSDNGAEVISVNDVEAAARALRAAQTARGVLASCQAAR